MFGLEKNIVHLYATVTFNPSGVPVLDTANSKGVCSILPESVVFTGSVTNSSTAIGTVSSFAGLFKGMTVTGTGVATNNTISSGISVAGGIIMTGQNIVTGDVTLTATGGRYVVQFGSQAGVRLDTYNKLLYVKQVWDETTSSAIGTATSVALAPSAPDMFIVKNNVGVRTIPQVSTSGSSDASISVMFGTGVGTAFTATNPGTGERVKLVFAFGNSTAV